MVWDGPTYQLYYSQIDRITNENLDGEDPKYLLQVDFHEYLDHLVEELAWEPLIWHEDEKTIEPFSVKVRRRDEFFGREFVVDEQRLRLRVPLSPHAQRADYFKFGPSTTWLGMPEPRWEFERDVLIHEVEATEQAVQKGIEDIGFWLGNRNKDIEQGNKTLRQRIETIWESRRRRLEEQSGHVEEVLRKLNIPLHQDPNARAKPVEIKPRQLRTVVSRPLAKAGPGEPMLHRDDVIALVDFIDGYVRQFEVAPKTYGRLGEEELRDLLVGMMNANYPGSTTAETFSKLGKTDISLSVTTGHALICECKFWSGAKAYTAALDQLFGYVTWRQSYAVLIHFCTLKDMSRAVSEAKGATQEHATYTVGTINDKSDTRFVSRHAHPQDDRKSVEIHHLFADLSV